MTRKQLIESIDQAIQRVVGGFPSMYIDFTDENDIHWVVRVADHNANPARVNEHTVSLVVLTRDNSNFRSLANQYYVDSDGCFFDNFRSMDEFVNYIFE